MCILRNLFKKSKLGGLGKYLPPCSHKIVVGYVRGFKDYAKGKGYFPLPAEVQVVLCHALNENQPRYVLYAYWFVNQWSDNRNGFNQAIVSDEKARVNTHKLMCVDMYLLVHGVHKDWMDRMGKSRKTVFLQELWNTKFANTSHIETWLSKYVKYGQ